MISPHPYLNPQAFCYIFFCPVQVRRGSDKVSLVDIWRPARLIQDMYIACFTYSIIIIPFFVVLLNCLYLNP